MSVSEFINHWSELSARNFSNSSIHEGCERPLLYLKDWHFVKEYPEYVAYETPLFFIDDWLNLYLDRQPMCASSDRYDDKSEINCSDYRFVYMGAKGTWTPLHADVFRSYSWSANVCGKKKWHLLPPSQCHLLFDRTMKNSVYDIFDDVLEETFPGFRKTVWLECTQEQNEIIFVPSGWYHQVLNMEDTISINHNWFNRCNLSWVWKLLLKDYKEAREYIDDIRDICDDFEGLCQRNLAANTGMNFIDFFIFISWFTVSNLTLLHCVVENNGGPAGTLSSGTCHLIRNLEAIRNVACNMKSANAFAGKKLLVCTEASADISTISKDPKFIEFCIIMNRTYGMIDERWRLAFQRKSTSNDSELHSLPRDLIEVIGSKLTEPEDLIRIINSAISNVIGVDRSQKL